MKIRVVSSKDEIGTLEDVVEIVHLAFRPSNIDVLSLIQRCSKIKALHVPKSYMVTISNSTRMVLEMKHVELLEGDVWGHRKDINEYYEIKPQVIARIQELKDAKKSVKDIVKTMSTESKLSKDLIKFLCNNPSSIDPQQSLKKT